MSGETMTVSERKSSVELLTPRQLEVLIVIGRERLSYKRAATQLEHRFDKGRGISYQTVRQYAKEIYALLDGTGSPREFLIEFYWIHREELEALT